MVLWSDRGHDGKLGAQGIVKTTLDGLQPGAIILLHDGFEARPDAQTDRSATVEALADIIDGARQAGYTFVAVRGGAAPASPLGTGLGVAWRLSRPGLPVGRGR